MSENFSAADIDQLVAVALEAAQAGAQELRQWRGRFAVQNKGVADYVTDADFASQAAIERILAQQFPDHAILGEESIDKQDKLSPEQVTWVIDPLDGTTNYVHDFPAYCVSIAAARGNELLAGVIHNPLTNEVYRAGRGRGAWLGDQPLRTSENTDLAGALIGFSLPSDVRGDSPDLVDMLATIPHTGGMRRLGSAALSLAWLARGVFDAYLAREIYPWDVAAGWLLITEAGGTVTNYQGQAPSLAQPAMIASSNPVLHTKLLSHLTAG